MLGTKSPFKSLGVWGGALAAISGMLGFSLTVADIKVIADHVEAIAQAVMALVATVSGLMAFIGRLRAKHRLQ